MPLLTGLLFGMVIGFFIGMWVQWAYTTRNKTWRLWSSIDGQAWKVVAESNDKSALALREVRPEEGTTFILPSSEAPWSWQ